MSERTPVLVVGGGIAGCAVALELAAGGVPVTVLERDRPGAGATGASAGMLAPQYEARGPDAVFLFGVACREAWPAFAGRVETLAGRDVGFRADGMLVANRDAPEEEAADEALAFQHGAGLRGEIVTPAEAARLHRDLAPGVPSWLWLPDEAQVDVQRLAAALGDAVRGAGGTVRIGTGVAAVTARSGRVTGVRLDDGTEVAGDRVVVAAGAWSSALEGMPRELPVRPVRGQVLRLLPDEPVPWPLVADHAARYLVPRANGTVLVGSTMEDVGFDDSTTEEGRAELAAAAGSLVPVLGEARVVESWAGLRPVSADRWPVLGPDPDLEGLHWATGHGRNGILFAPVAGRAVAELVVDGATGVEWEGFGVGRFG